MATVQKILIQFLWITIGLLLLSGCAPNKMVEIQYPSENAIIYSDTLSIRGSSQSLDSFLVQVVTNNQVIVEYLITSQEDQWALQVPSETLVIGQVELVALSPDAEEMARRKIHIQPFSSRPEGAFVKITTPDLTQPIAGDSVQIAGNASGINGAFLLRLQAEENVLDEQVVDASDPIPINAIYWQSQLDTQGHVGSAILEIYRLSELDERQLVQTINIELK